MSDPPEPAITINGVALSMAEAMTIRVALGAFAMTLQATGLGDDDHGKAMTQNYLAAIRRIHTVMRQS